MIVLDIILGIFALLAGGIVAYYALIMLIGTITLGFGLRNSFNDKGMYQGFVTMLIITIVLVIIDIAIFYGFSLVYKDAALRIAG